MKDIMLSRLGWGVFQGTIVEWHKNVGDKVGKAEKLYTAESAMGKVTFYSDCSGIITERLVEAGAVANVGSVIARMDLEGE